jgi:hypothetical protein
MGWGDKIYIMTMVSFLEFQHDFRQFIIGNGFPFPTETQFIILAENTPHIAVPEKYCP